MEPLIVVNFSYENGSKSNEWSRTDRNKSHVKRGMGRMIEMSKLRAHKIWMYFSWKWWWFTKRWVMPTECFFCRTVSSRFKEINRLIDKWSPIKVKNKKDKNVWLNKRLASLNIHTNNFGFDKKIEIAVHVREYSTIRRENERVKLETSLNSLST